MSTTDYDTVTQIGEALPVDETGWSRLGVWVDPNSSEFGDYHVGPAFTAIYQAVAPDGRIVEIHDAYYAEVKDPDEPDGERFGMNRVMTREAVSMKALDEGHSDDDFSYEHISYTADDAEPAALARQALADVRHCLNKPW